AGVSDVPFVGPGLHFDQSLVGFFGEIDVGLFCALVGDAIDPAVLAIGDVVVVAFAGVAPIDEVDVAGRAVVQAHAFEPLVIRQQEVGAVAGDEAGTFCFERIVVDAVAVGVAHEDAAAVLGRKGVAVIEHAAGVGVPAA